MMAARRPSFVSRGTVHFTHTAGTERLENLVITQATARFEHHRPSFIADREPAGTEVQTSCLRLGGSDRELAVVLPRILISYVSTSGTITFRNSKASKSLALNVASCSTDAASSVAARAVSRIRFLPSFKLDKSSSVR